MHVGDLETNLENGLFLFLTPSPNNSNYYCILLGFLSSCIVRISFQLLCTVPHCITVIHTSEQAHF